MEFIDIKRLNQDIIELREDYQSRVPFKFTLIENFLVEQKAEEILREYPKVDEGEWDGVTYIDQRNKFQKTKFKPDSSFARLFADLNSSEFLEWLEKLSGIRDLQGDPDLLGGGLHQSITGAFLNVHIDYNLHHVTKLHRRLNVLIYMNKGWKDEYEGHLELWDFTGGNEKRIERIAPTFNRAVIFETNEISFHGHPKPLKTPPHVTRKSIATYYYTNLRPESEIAPEHNTVYVNTEGVKGQAKRFSSGVKAFLERVNRRR